MMRSLHALLAVCLLTTSSGPLRAQALPPAAANEVGFSAEGLERVTELLDRAVEEGRIAGAVAGIARHGRQAYLRAVGVQSLETGEAMTEASLFRIYSMAKAVTAVGVMILHEEGAFDLDDPVSAYLPAFSRVRVAPESGDPGRPPGRPVTIRDLLLHTSGLSHRSSQLYRDLEVRSRSISMERFIENIVAAPLMEDPGTRYRYSAAPTVLGGLIEVWSGEPLDEFLHARIFEPLGMTDTGFWVEPERQDRLTTVYRQTEQGLTPYQIEAVPFTEKPQLLEGAVGLVSTVPDFMRFSQMLLNGGILDGARILREETVAEITGNGLSEEVLATRRPGTGWGLANVSVVLDPESLSYLTSVGEYGWDGSAGTIFWNNPEEDLVVVLMWQSSPANPDSLRQRVKTVVHEAFTD
jgi:CubicO group peptidase (beta-lactamase class C family)